MVSWLIRRVEGRRYSSLEAAMVDYRAARTDEERACVRRNALKSGYKLPHE